MTRKRITQVVLYTATIVFISTAGYIGCNGYNAINKPLLSENEKIKVDVLFDSANQSKTSVDVIDSTPFVDHRLWTYQNHTLPDSVKYPISDTLIYYDSAAGKKIKVNLVQMRADVAIRDTDIYVDIPPGIVLKRTKNRAPFDTSSPNMVVIFAPKPNATAAPLTTSPTPKPNTLEKRKQPDPQPRNNALPLADNHEPGPVAHQHQPDNHTEPQHVSNGQPDIVPRRHPISLTPVQVRRRPDIERTLLEFFKECINSPHKQPEPSYHNVLRDIFHGQTNFSCTMKRHGGTKNMPFADLVLDLPTRDYLVHDIDSVRINITGNNILSSVTVFGH